MKYAKLIGTGSCLPDRVVTNDDLAKILDTSDEWIRERSGIGSRHLADDHENTATMAIEAARKAIEMAKITADAIDLIIVATCSPARQLPSNAAIVQEALNIPNVPAFDIAAACAGFVYGLDLVNRYMQTGGAKCALLIGTEKISSMLDWNDRRTCVLFGDGAGAAILQASDEPGLIATKLRADGRQGFKLYVTNDTDELMEGESTKPHVRMSGREVFKYAVTALGDMAEEILEDAKFSKNDIDWMVPHQANLRIIQAAAKRLDLPMEKVILTLETHGNTSAASVPLALDHGIRTGQIKPGQNLLLEAFGGGFTWGAALLKY